MLKYFYTGHLPVYATSSIYNYQSKRFRDHDLDGITFSGTPWLAALLNPPKANQFSWQALPSHLQQIWPKDFSYHSRFFAIGVDAYQLSYHLQHLRNFPYAFISGATGALYLSPQHHIRRMMTWMEIKHGKVHQTTVFNLNASNVQWPSYSSNF